jgi:hypothetical protein
MTNAGAFLRARWAARRIQAQTTPIDHLISLDRDRRGNAGGATSDKSAASILISAADASDGGDHGFV